MIAKKERKPALTGSTYRYMTGCGPLYVTVNEDDGEIFEIFTTIGKAGGCAASQVEAIRRIVSLGLKSGIDPAEFAKQLQGISCHSPVMVKEEKISSCADAIAKAIKTHIKSKKETKNEQPST